MLARPHTAETVWASNDVHVLQALMQYRAVSSTSLQAVKEASERAIERRRFGDVSNLSTQPV